MIPGTTSRREAPKAGAPWSDDETTRLMMLLADGLQPSEIAQQLGRSKESICSAMRKLRDKGLIPARTTRNLWTPEESARVVEMRHAGKTLEQMAEDIGRHVESVRSHISTLRSRGVNVTIPPRPKQRENGKPMSHYTPEESAARLERVERVCLGFECSRKFLAPSRFLRMCEICRAQAKRVCW